MNVGEEMAPELFVGMAMLATAPDVDPMLLQFGQPSAIAVPVIPMVAPLEPASAIELDIGPWPLVLVLPAEVPAVMDRSIEVCLISKCLVLLPELLSVLAPASAVPALVEVLATVMLFFRTLN